MSIEPITTTGLPPELIMCIAGFLAPEDLVCFSLCDRQIYRFFPSQRSRVRAQYKSHYLTEEDNNIRLSILSPPDRDWPSYSPAIIAIISTNTMVQNVLVSVDHYFRRAVNCSVLDMFFTLA